MAKTGAIHFMRALARRQNINKDACVGISMRKDAFDFRRSENGTKRW
jgi:hypothetical protein